MILAEDDFIAVFNEIKSNNIIFIFLKGYFYKHPIVFYKIYI